MGGTNFVIGVISFILLTLLLPKHRWALRVTRVPCGVLVAAGVAQSYAAYRGFCCIVWGRRAMQIKPWEMDIDEEAVMEGKSSPEGSPTDQVSPSKDDIFPISEPPCAPASPAHLRPIALDSLRPPDASVAFPIFDEPPISVSELAAGSHVEIRALLSSHGQQNQGEAGHIPPKAFGGPERVIRDPRVFDYHTHIFREVFYVFLAGLVVTIPICISVPVAGLAH